MKLDTLGLEAFVAIAETGRFGRAAETLHITQTALTRRLQNLEELLGVTLVERTTRSVALTRLGRDFRLLLTTFVVQALATGAMLAGVDYVARHVLERPGAATILFVCFVGPALLLTPVWARFGERAGKKRGYVAASLVLRSSPSCTSRSIPSRSSRSRHAKST